MILLRDAIRLSYTKLRIRPVRLAATVIICSLLFAFVTVLVTLAYGSVRSVKELNTEGLSNRFLVYGTPVAIPQTYNNSEFLDQVEKAQNDIIARKAAEAKRLGVEYDPKTEARWVTNQDGVGRVLSGYSDEVFALEIAFIRSSPNIDFASFDTYMKQRGALQTFQLTSEYGFGGNALYAQVLKNGQENFRSNENSFPDFMAKGFSALDNSQPRVSSDALLEPFLLEGQDLSLSKDGHVPVLASFSVAEESLGLEQLSAGAAPTERLQRIDEVRSRVAGTTFQVCYRNSTSAGLLNDALNQKRQDEQYKNDKTYVRPSLVYGLPSTPCGEVPIIRDVRSTEEKRIATKQEQFDVALGKQPQQAKAITFRIVGLLPDRNDNYSLTASSLLSSIVQSSIGAGWIIPESVAVSDVLAGYVTPFEKADPRSLIYVAEIDSSEAQNNIIKNLSCNPYDSSGGVPPPVGIPISDPFANTNACVDAGTPYYFSIFGNNASVIEQFEKYFNRGLLIALGVLVLLSGLVIMGVIGRTISDSRRETAVFRAIGATRFDMSSVYLLYSLIIASGVVVAALGIGLGTAYLLDSIWSPNTTPAALLVFNVSDLSKEFRYFAIDYERLAYIGVAIYTATLFGLLGPLISNMRRNPLRDMRDENR